MSGAFEFKSESGKQGGQESEALTRSAVSKEAPSQSDEPAPAPSISKSDALAELVKLAAEAAANGPRHVPKHTPKHPTEKGKFEPGKKPVPRSGQTVHEIMKDHGKLSDLHGHMSKWEKEHGPNKKPKGPDIHKMMGGKISHAQATRLARKIADEHQKFLQKKVGDYYGKGAKAALERDT